VTEVRSCDGITAGGPILPAGKPLEIAERFA
jgi:hypothetical protein